MANKNDKPEIAQTALWPFVFAMRWMLGGFLIYIVATLIFCGFAIKQHPYDQLSWADEMINYYVQVGGNDDTAAKAGRAAHSLVFESLGMISMGRTSDKKAMTDKSFWSNMKTPNPITKSEFFELWQRSTYLFGVRLYHILIAVPAFALVAALGMFDGLSQRAIRTACAGHESASLYHRAKFAAFTLAAPLAAAVYLCSPWNYHPIYLLVPALLATSLLLRVQYTFYKKYV